MFSFDLILKLRIWFGFNQHEIIDIINDDVASFARDHSRLITIITVAKVEDVTILPY